jgi:hypothetical protein
MLVRCGVKPQLLEAWQDGELGGWRARWLKSHVALCSRCQDYLAQLAERRRLLACLPAVQPRADFTAQVLAKLASEEEAPVLPRLAGWCLPAGRLAGRQFVALVMARIAAAQQRRQRRRQLALAWAVSLVLIVSLGLVVGRVRSRPQPLLKMREIAWRLGSVRRWLSPDQWLFTRAARGALALQQRAAAEAGCELGVAGPPSGSLVPREAGLGPGAQPRQNHRGGNAQAPP